MVKIKVTRKGNWVFLEGQPTPLPLTKDLKKIFGEKTTEWFEATVNQGIITLVRTVPAPC